MNQATLIVGAIMVAFIGFVAIKQRLGVYRAVIIGGGTATGQGGVTSGGGGGATAVPGNSPAPAGGGTGGSGNHPTLPFVP